MTDSDCSTLGDGDIRFYDRVLPTLDPGDYLINFTQRVNPTTSPTSPPVDESFGTYQAFSVQGPRYSLPAGDVFSCFPPENAQGIFDQFLPQVVLTRPDLPWELNIFKDADAQRTPWMTLLLFVSKKQPDGSLSLEPLNGSSNPSLMDPLTTPPWTKNSNKVASLAASSFASHDGTPDADGILWPALEGKWSETQDYLGKTMVNAIDIDPAAFTLLMPNKSALRYLAHARQVDITSKDSTVLQATQDGWCSVIVGSRLPAADPTSINIVHLVSLEGFENWISESGIPTLPSGTKRVRMISLKSWSFTCLSDAGEGFHELTLNLLKNGDGTPKSTSFALPATESLGSNDAKTYTYTLKTIQSGFVPLKYQTRLGEQTFAWYRGPFSPVPVQNFVHSLQQGSGNPDEWRPFSTASSALIYDQNYGIFNVSYGVAWETGRLLALSDGTFGQELLDWQRQGHRLVDRIVERMTQMSAFKGFDPESPDAGTEKEILDAIEPYAMTDNFMRYLVTELAGEIEPQATDASPPPAAFPAYPDQPTPVTNPKTIANLMTQRKVQKVIRSLGGRELVDIANWLGELYMLKRVPFENLVPLADLLPPESIRFFYLDSNWLDSLVEGALSIGIESSRDRLYQDMMKDLIWDQTSSAMQTLRDQLLGAQASRVPSGGTVRFDQESMAGMLLRSALVSGWPGLEFNAYTGSITENGEIRPDPATLLKPLRMDRLASDVMLCLWPAIPAVVTIEEPKEGIVFGFEDPPPSKSTDGYYVYPRSMDPANYGVSLCTDDEIETDQCQHMIDASRMIDQTTRVVDVVNLAGAIQSNLNLGQALNVRDFAVQMIKVPEEAVFASISIPSPKEAVHG